MTALRSIGMLIEAEATVPRLCVAPHVRVCWLPVVHVRVCWLPIVIVMMCVLMYGGTAVAGDTIKGFDGAKPALHELQVVYTAKKYAACVEKATRVLESSFRGPENEKNLTRAVALGYRGIAKANLILRDPAFDVNERSLSGLRDARRDLEEYYRLFEKIIDLPEYKKAVDYFDNFHGTMLSLIAAICELDGDDDNAISWCDAIVATIHHKGVLFNAYLLRGKIYARSGEMKLAKENLRQAELIFRTHPLVAELRNSIGDK